MAKGMKKKRLIIKAIKALKAIWEKDKNEVK